MGRRRERVNLEREVKEKIEILHSKIPWGKNTQRVPTTMRERIVGMKEGRINHRKRGIRKTKILCL